MCRGIKNISLDQFAAEGEYEMKDISIGSEYLISLKFIVNEIIGSPKAKTRQKLGRLLSQKEKKNEKPESPNAVSPRERRLYKSRKPARKSEEFLDSGLPKRRRRRINKDVEDDENKEKRRKKRRRGKKDDENTNVVSPRRKKKKRTRTKKEDDSKQSEESKKSKESKEILSCDSPIEIKKNRRKKREPKEKENSVIPETKINKRRVESKKIPSKNEIPEKITIIPQISKTLSKRTLIVPTSPRTIILQPLGGQPCKKLFGVPLEVVMEQQKDTHPSLDIPVFFASADKIIREKGLKNSNFLFL